MLASAKQRQHTAMCPTTSFRSAGFQPAESSPGYAGCRCCIWGLLTLQTRFAALSVCLFLRVSLRLSLRLSLCLSPYLLLCSSPALARQSDPTYDLRGQVTNSVTGAPIPYALVQLASGASRFTANDGSFLFPNLPRGTYQLSVRKPGYFDQIELGNFFRSHQAIDLPADSDAILALTPEAIVYGTVENEAGRPLEGITVRAQSWQATGVGKRLQTVAQAVSNDQGQFRIAELRPGTYFLNFTAANSNFDSRQPSELARKKPNQEGYGSQFYPGMFDLTTAVPLRLRGGAQVQIVEKMKRVSLYQVSGVVHGASLERNFQVHLSDSEGVWVQKLEQVDPKTGEFQITDIPEGNYLLIASGMSDEKNSRRLIAALPIHLVSDVTGLNLTLGRGALINAVLDDQIPRRDNEIHRVSLILTATDFMQNTQGLNVASPRNSASVDGVLPGTYRLQASVQGNGYIAAIRCGDLDLLRDDLTISAGASVPTIEVTIRDDPAELQVQVTENNQPASALVLIYSVDYPQTSVVVGTSAPGSAASGELRPGSYSVVALKTFHQPEFRDPEVMQKYLAHSKSITLNPGDKPTLQLEVQSIDEED